MPVFKKSLSASNKIDSVFDKDNSTNTEILWTLKVIMNHFSFRSCMDLDKLFKAMFPDSEIAKQFKLSKTKCSYFINFGIASVFKTNLTKEINMPSFYSFSFDESVNSVMQQCQMDVVVRY